MKKIEDEYLQGIEEDFEEWKYRLLLGKTKKTVKISWDEIADLLGMSHKGEYLRKIAYGVSEYDRWQRTRRLQENEEEMTIDDLYEVFELEEKKIELEKEKVRMQDQRRYMKRTLREWARAEKVKEDIQNAVMTLNKEDPIRIAMPEQKSKKQKVEAAALLSDWHRGSRSNNHWNFYTDVEYKKRVGKLTQKIIEYGKIHGVSVLHLFLMGDLINGLIHVTTRIENMENVVESTKIVAETIAQVIKELAPHFSEIKIYSVRGNHDRVTPAKAESVSRESFFDFIPWYLEARLSETKHAQLIKNEIDDEISVADICGSKVFAVHGHKDRIGQVASNLAYMVKEFPDYIFMGHYHHHEENEFHGCEVIINSSLSGTDEYAKDIRRTSKPAQKFIIFNEEEGRVCTYNIRLDK